MFIHIDLWLIGILLSVACYLVNYLLMWIGIGIYNNDPNHEWQGECGERKRGPSIEGRAWLFVFSPVTVPVIVFVILPIILTYKAVLRIVKSTTRS